MTQLDFEILEAEPEPFAAVPTLTFRLRASEHTGEAVHAIALRCQIRIEPQRRRYVPAEEEALGDLFGTPDRWGTTLKPFLWTHVSTMVPGFEDSTEFDLPVTCTYDLEVAATKYFDALETGTIPLLLLFSGTVFVRGMTGFAVEQLSWELEARHALPIEVWRRVIDEHFPASSWLRVHRDTLERLRRIKHQRGLTSWDSLLSALADQVEEVRA